MNIRILFVLWLMYFDHIASATHVIGSDWQYKCLNANGDYEITLILYRDCSGIALCSNTCGAACTYSSQIVGASTGCYGTSFGSVSLNLVSVRDVNLNPRCPNAKSICSNMGCVTPGTFTPGVERYEFRGTVNLGATSGIPTSCCTVSFTYSLCCRNNSIATGAASANYYTEMTINRCLATPALSQSPLFTRDVPHILCNFQPTIINGGAVDPDLDSLSYSFVPSLAGKGASVPYVPPYSFDRPLPWSGPSSGQFPNGIYCNPTSGDISFTPAASGNFVGIMAIGIDEWRRNPSTFQYEKLSSVRRDMMVWIRSCDANGQPTISTTPSLIQGTHTPRTSWLFYTGRENCFEITANDTDATDTTYLSWNGSIASRGATFLPNYIPSQRRLTGPRQDNYRFCWTPADSNIREQPYIFTVKAEDSRCPLNGSHERAFQVYVRTPPTTAAANRQNIICNQYNFTANINAGSGWYNHIDWTVTQTPDDRNFNGPVGTYRNNGFLSGVQFGKAGRYYIKQDVTIFYQGNLNNHITIIDSIDIAQNGFAFNVNDTFFCSNQPLVLRPQVFNPADDTLNYVWTNTSNPTVALSIVDSLEISRDVNNRTYVLLMDNGKGCIMRDTFIVRRMPLAVSTQIWGPAVVQLDKSYEYEVANTPSASYEWTIENGTILAGQGTRKVSAAWNTVGAGKINCNEIINGCKHDTLNLVTSISLPTVSVSETVRTNAFTLFPNPAHSKIYLKSDIDKPIKVDLMDMSGKMLHIQFTEQQPGIWRMNVSELPDGLYTALVHTENGSSWIQRFRKSAVQVR